MILNKDQRACWRRVCIESIHQWNNEQMLEALDTLDAQDARIEALEATIAEWENIMEWVAQDGMSYWPVMEAAQKALASYRAEKEQRSVESSTGREGK